MPITVPNARGMTTESETGMPPFAGGGQGEPASVPPVGGAGAKRPAEHEGKAHLIGEGGEAPRKQAAAAQTTGNGILRAIGAAKTACEVGAYARRDFYGDIPAQARRGGQYPVPGAAAASPRAAAGTPRARADRRPIVLGDARPTLYRSEGGRWKPRSASTNRPRVLPTMS